jgi:two-component system cell cycle response regulator
MSLRIKFIVALLVTSLASVALVGLVAHHRLMARFNDIVLARAAQNFRGDVGSYWLTYGSWDEGQRVETFRHFSQRRLASMKQSRLPPDPARRFEIDTGGAAEAAALPRWSAASAEASPVDPPGHTPVVRGEPPFRFILFDPSGRVLNTQHEPSRVIPAAEQRRSIPVVVEGRIVAFASPVGILNFSPADRSYIAAVWDANAWGMAAAALIAVGLGLLVGNRMSQSLRQLTGAVKAMQDGTLHQQVDIASRDEVGVLAHAFNAMSRDLAASHQRLLDSHRTISRQAEQLAELAVRDSLTGLHNRRHFDELAQAMYDHSHRYGQPLVIALADIDHFKRINDGFSHATGDAVLREIAALLRAHIRSSDLVARYGGEEFAFAFPESQLDAAAECCERLQQSIAAHPWRNIHPELAVTMSFGVTADVSAGGVEAMLAAADHLLYAAKTQGRNRVVRSEDNAGSTTVPTALLALQGQ